MLTKLTFERFKNFEKTELSLGPLSLLIGTNASGKSNIRDAFRFLHGISRGYTLADIMGEKYIEAGVLQWRGIRGGLREATYRQAKRFALTINFNVQSMRGRYFIRVEPGSTRSQPRVITESLYCDKELMFTSHPRPPYEPIKQIDTQLLKVRIPPGGNYPEEHIETFIAYQPVLSQIEERLVEKRNDDKAEAIRRFIAETISMFDSMRFLDLNPEAMRRPSLPGQTILGDQGENLSSVLQAICEDPRQKNALVEWLKELTPMDATDFKFPTDQMGRILVSLIEENGQRISAYSASDGTLRFLAMIAAFLGPEPARFYFFEELENGLHPARLHLLIQLVEQQISKGNIQMVATSHSPQLLRFLSPSSLDGASLVYRLPNRPDARIRRILDIPDIRRVIKQHDLANLHESGWFEDTMFFDEPEV